MLRAAELPPYACWRHQGARIGFETACFTRTSTNGVRVQGHTAALEAGEPFLVQYAIDLDDRWMTRSVQIDGRTVLGTRAMLLESDGSGAWRGNGEPLPWLDGCVDVDLESSALTNAFPVRRLGLACGESAAVPAVYVRALTLGVDRLDQTYNRVDNDPDGRQRFRYEAPAFEFRCELIYDDAGLVLDYPGLAARVMQ